MRGITYHAVRRTFGSAAAVAARPHNILKVGDGGGDGVVGMAK